MFTFQRREFLTGAGALGAAAAATALGTPRALAGDPSFMNNVPDPLLSGKELPTFKFELEKSQGRVIDGSYGKEVTVEQLPISKGIAGVSMKLQPGCHARASLACHRGRVGVRGRGANPDDGHRPAGICGDERLRARGRVVFPPRPRSHARVPR